MKSHQFRKGWFEILLVDLKWSLGIPETATYEKFGIFKVQVLDKAQRALEDHTDIKFEYKTVKEGRKVVALKCKVTESKKIKKVLKAALKPRCYVRAGDVVSIDGKQYPVDGDCIRDENGEPLPIGRVNELVKAGIAKIQ